MPAQPHWEHFEHDADVGIRGLGNTKNEAFAQAAVAMTAVVTTPSSVQPVQSVHVECIAPDDELLLFEWLNSLVFEMATRKMLFARFEVTDTDEGLVGTAWGEPIDIDRHQPAAEVKGATWTELSVSHDDDGWWTAQCVVDV